MSKEKEGCALAILSLAAIPAMVIWKGYVLSILWGWFVAEQFGLIVLSIPQAIGLAIVVAMLTHTYNKDSEGDDMYKTYAIAFLGPLISLGAGWIVKLCL